LKTHLALSLPWGNVWAVLVSALKVVVPELLGHSEQLIFFFGTATRRDLL